MKVPENKIILSPVSWMSYYQIQQPLTITIKNIRHYYLHHSAVLRPVHSLFQREFATDCDIMPPLSISSVFPFPYGHPTAAYVFLLVFPSLLCFPYILPSITCFRRQFLHYSIQLLNFRQTLSFKDLPINS
jgi:hypothetical protein